MWISELSERTGIPVDTIKHYLRVGVLPKGRSVGPLRAEYDDHHVVRLRLVKALTEVGDLKLEQIRRVFDQADEASHTPGPLVETLSAAHYELSRAAVVGRVPTREALAAVDAMIRRRGWLIGPDSTHRVALALTVEALLPIGDAIGIDERPLDALLDLYSAHLDDVAHRELLMVDFSSPESVVLNAIGATVLSEPLLVLVRRLAQENAAHVSAAGPLPDTAPHDPSADPSPDPSPGRRWTDPAADDS